ncbi:MAG: glycosyl hydrolase family 28 protein [Polyangiaceae bacterium]|nr:glycosyl hydrolase family 28 protein [Polyangiaceae bacterium]
MDTNVLDFGAIGDGRTDDTEAIQLALDRVSAAGGGTLLLPPGVYSCNTLHLRSHVLLHLSEGAVLQSREEAVAYPIIGRTPNLPGKIQAFLWGEKLVDFGIEGPGSIDGGHPEALSGAEAAAISFRPALVFLRDCQRLHLSGCELRNSAYWTAHLQRCEDVVMQGLTLRSHPHRINADGIDPDGCRRVKIIECDVSTGDDAIVLKSTEGDLCEDIIVERCVLRSSCAAAKLGTESLGIIRRVVVRNCRLESLERGIALHLKDGGAFEDVSFEDCTVLADGRFAILIDASPRHPEHPFPGNIRRVLLRRLDVRTAGRFLIESEPPGLIEDLRVEDLSWYATGPLDPNATKPAGAARTSVVAKTPAPLARFAARGVQGLVITRFEVHGDRSAKELDIVAFP